MNNDTANSKVSVSDDEALAVFALTQLDRGTSAGDGISRNRVQKPTSKTVAPAADFAAATANTTTTTATITNSNSKPPVSIVQRRTGKFKQGVPKAVSIQSIPKKGNYVNHSYSDYSAVPNDQNYHIPESLEDMTFAEKLHVVLSTAEYQHCISWLPHGRAFRVSIPVFFEKTVCPKFFGHKRFSSFLRQLNNHGFKHLTSGSSRNGYYHECFLRGDGLEHIVHYMPRAKDARRQVPDPDNEPDFDTISMRFPLPQVKSRAALQDGANAPVSGVEAKIRAIIHESLNHEEEQAKPKARTFDTMAAAGEFANATSTATTTTTLDQSPAAKKPALLFPFAQIPPLPPPQASALGGLPMSDFGGLPTNLWALSLRNQQVMEQLQLQQQLQQMMSLMQQGDAAEQLLRSLYNNR